MTTICPQCGAEVRASREYCDRCGGALHGSEVVENGTEVAAPALCGYCGHRSPPGSDFCTYCGLPLGDPSHCPECHGPIRSLDRYCPKCGRILRPERITRTSLRPLAALVLAIIPGMFSIWGVGHIFARKVRRGLAFMVLGLVLTLVAPITLLFLVQDMGGLVVLAVFGLIIWVAAWLFQSMDAYYEAGGE